LKYRCALFSILSSVHEILTNGQFRNRPDPTDGGDGHNEEGPENEADETDRDCGDDLDYADY